MTAVEILLEILNGLVLLKRDDKLNRIYWSKNGEIIFEQDMKFGWLLIHSDNVWKKLKDIKNDITTIEISDILSIHSDLCTPDDSCIQVRFNDKNGKYEKLEKLSVFVGNKNKNDEWKIIKSGGVIRNWYHV